jgi:hypothetical protein
MEGKNKRVEKDKRALIASARKCPTHIPLVFSWQDNSEGYAFVGGREYIVLHPSHFTQQHKSHDNMQRKKAWAQK